MTPSAGIEPGTHWWKASALTTAPTLLPCMHTTRKGGVDDSNVSSLFFFLFGTISQCIASWLDYKLFVFQDDVIFRQHAAETAQKSTPVHGQPASKLSQAVRVGKEREKNNSLPFPPSTLRESLLARMYLECHNPALCRETFNWINLP